MRQKNFRILIINRNPKILDSLGLALAKKGHYIMFAFNLEMAMEFINNIQLDLIIIGINEIENQIEILKKLKELFPIVPALIISGEGLKKAEYFKLLHNGASGFIKTSFDIEELAKIINRVINWKIF